MKPEEKIKRTIVEILEKLDIRVKAVILFGSRAREDYQEGSDYDILVVIDKTLSGKEKMEVSKRLRMALVEFPIDIILKSEEEIEAQKDMIGSVVREALKEGITL